MHLSRCPQRFLCIFVVLSGLVLTAGLTGCDCEGTISARAVVEMSADPDRVPADGRPGIEVSVLVFADSPERVPMQGVVVEVRSDRNAAGTVDEIEQPAGPTDADGRAVAFVGSNQEGVAELSAWSGGDPLCTGYDADGCVPAVVQVTFEQICPSGQTACSGECVDIATDLDHCGRCDKACSFENAAALCTMGQCAMGACETGFADCNRDSSDGCEARPASDPLNCGSCDNACAEGEVCRDGACALPCADADGDGYEDSACGGPDCADDDPDVHPGAAEDCDGVDDDCDGQTDEDLDAQACDDQNPCTADTCEPGVGCQFENLDGQPCDDADGCTTADTCLNAGCFGTPVDADGDGYRPQFCGGADCDDENDAVNPGQTEVGLLCSNGVDDDCDGQLDGDDSQCEACGQDADCDDGNPCNGVETCQATACQAGNPPDCDDGNPCTTDSCDPGVLVGCVNEPAQAACDDGQWCTVNDQCDLGQCTGQARDCSAAGDTCNQGVCDEALDECQPSALPDDTPCDDGVFCTDGDVCQAGTCQGGLRDCSGVADQCNNATCDEVAGACMPVPIADGTLCSDGFYCTTGDACAAGVCQGLARDCSGFGNQCNQGACDEAGNTCMAQPLADGTACSDGVYCTDNDACTAGVCGGTARDCSAAGDQCNTGICDELAGACLPQPVANGTVCDDADACSMGDACSGGVCGGVPLDADGDLFIDQACGGQDCDDGNAAINPSVFEGPYGDPICADGTDNDCDTQVDDADSGCMECVGNGDCDDGDVCNGAETCQAGSCVAGAPLNCDDGNACTDDSCDSQAGCQHANHSRPCDDGQWCTLNDVCDGAGACVGSGTPCAQQCLGTCNEAQQQCDPSPDGTGCNDGQWCTEGDACASGVCTGAARDCSAAGDQCNAGVCDEAGDACVAQAVPDGTGCSDGLFCTSGDVCTSGSCAGFARNCDGAGNQCNDGVCDEVADACVAQPLADGTLCNDGAFCSVSDACTGGVCGGAARDCSGAGDQCNTGVCSEAQDLCVPQAVPDGTGCNDGEFCSVNDACSSGVCGGAARDCSGAGDQCNTGVCDDVVDQCQPQPVADGTGCDDTLYCTRNDVCTAGVCDGAPRDCSAAGDQCNTGVCDDGSDQCVPQPVVDGTGCNDGAYCTVSDACTGGTCGGAARDCSAAGDQCNAGVCDEVDDQCEPQPLADGTVCDDLDACTMADECTAGVCSGPPLDGDSDGFVDDACSGGTDCDDGDPLINPGVFEGPGGDPECNDGFDNDCDTLIDLNDPGCGECFDDGDCDDGDVCNGAETCDAGSCQAGTALNCDDGDPCTDDGCDPIAGCQYGFNTAPCNDGLFCTTTDTCDGAGNCSGVGSPCVAQCLGTCDEANDACDPSPDGTGCNDGAYCTISDQCTGGVCGGAARDCTGVGDQCNDGVCDEAQDLCVPQAKADGVPCEDGLFCTAGDACDGAGACSGGVADPCPIECQSVCNEGGDSCDDDPDGTGCDDGDGCTMNDACASGACSGPPTDGDGDGYVWDACGGGDDCNDGNGAINPGATEVCDGVDNDCDGLNDQRPCANQEGVCAGSLQGCAAGDWQACNYGAVANHEWVEVSCDGLDNDCDGCTDEGCAGYGNPVVSVEVIPFTSRPGLSRISGNGQAGPVGAVLPNALVVQLNDGSGNPMPGELVTFAVEATGAVCYGQGGIHSPSNGLDDLVIHLVCNDVDSGSLTSPAQVRTDINGQARVIFQLPPDVPGMSGISATANAQTVFFFASSTQALADNNPIDLPGDGYSPPDNPAVGPLTVTIRSGGSAAFLSDPDNYTLTITGLSSSADAVGDAVADAPLTAGGILTISGRNFSTPANSNSVWIGGLPATVTGGSATSLTVQIPAGSPGASAVVVDDGTGTAFAGGTGNVPSVASAVANLWRLASKPIYIFADTGAQSGSTAQVKLLGRDVCGNPLDLAGESISLWTEDPDGGSPSGPVSVGAPHPSTGIATVANTGATRGAAYVVGSVGALSSADFTDGNTTVTTVAWSRSPANFIEDPALANDDGINSIIFRGGTGGSGETNNPDMNPAVRFTFVHQTNYVVPDGTGPDYETEAHIVAGTMIGEGNITYVPGSNRRAAMAGTGLLVASGSPAGVLGTVSANANYCIRIIFFNVCGDMSVEGVLLPGWYRQTAAEQEYEMNYSGLMYYDVNEHRNLILRLLTQRSLP